MALKLFYKTEVYQAAYIAKFHKEKNRHQAANAKITRMKISKLSIPILLGLLAVFSCRKDELDKHIAITDTSVKQSLLDEIKADTTLSSFASYLAKTGYDEVVSSSKTFTVWAPTNAAFRSIDQSYLTDTAKLRLLIGNYIANQAFFSTDAADTTLRIKTLNGKRVVFTGDSLNDVALTAKDIRAKNGVLHKLSTAFLPQPNLWEYLNENYTGSLQQSFLQTLQYQKQDPDSAELIGLDPNTGDPIYKAGTGLVTRNRYLQKVDISNEDSLLTYIILSDAAYSDQQTKLASYFVDSTQQTSDSLTQWNIVKDLCVQGVILPDNIPETLYSDKDSLQIHLDKNAIIKTQKVSNGIVYVVNKLDYELNTKIKPVTIQGESFYDRLDDTKSYTIRTRRNPANDSVFNDILMQNFGIASYWIRYPVTLNSVTYHVYWRAVNDFQTGTFPMKLAFKTHSDTAFATPTNIPFDITFPYTTVQLLDYSDVYLGDFTPGMHGIEDVFCIGNSVTTNGNNTIVLDYIKLVPVLN